MIKIKIRNCNDCPLCDAEHKECKLNGWTNNDIIDEDMPKMEDNRTIPEKCPVLHDHIMITY